MKLTSVAGSRIATALTVAAMSLAMVTAVAQPAVPDETSPAVNVDAKPFGEPGVTVGATGSISDDSRLAGAGISSSAADANAGIGYPYAVGGDGFNAGGSYAFGYPTNELFYNYYVPPVNGGIGAEMYVAPLPVPPHVGHTYFTYQPFYPHEMLYRHHRTYYRPHPGFEGYPTASTPYTRVDVQWTNGRSPLQFAPSILRARRSIPSTY